MQHRLDGPFYVGLPYDGLHYVGLFALTSIIKMHALLFEFTLVTLVCIYMYVSGIFSTCVIK